MSCSTTRPSWEARWLLPEPASPWADQSVGVLGALAMACLAGQILAPVCADRDVNVGEFAGLFHYLYLDVCPPSLQSEEIGHIGVAHRVHNLSIGGAGVGELPPSLQSLPPFPPCT